MNLSKPIYKLIDGKGRVYLPKELRQTLEADCGDFVKLTWSGNGIRVSKVHLIEVGDRSNEATEAYVSAAVAVMPAAKRLELATKLLEQLKQENTQLEG